MEGDVGDQLFPLIHLLRQHASLFDDDNPWMKKSVDPPPTCALNPPDVTQRINSNQNGQVRDDSRPVKAGDGSQGFRSRRQKRDLPFPPQRTIHSWLNPSFENSPPIWTTPTIKSEPNPTHYKVPSRPAYYQQSGEWAEQPSASNVQQSNYGMVQPSQNNSVGHGSSNYDYNGMYNNSNTYNNYVQTNNNSNNYGQPNNSYGQINNNSNNYVQPNTYYPPNYGQQTHAYHGQPQQRMGDGYNRNIAAEPMVKPPVPEFQRKKEYAELQPRVQIKKEPEDYLEGQNFTSLFTQSLLSLDAQDVENTFSESNTSEIQIIPQPPPPPIVHNVEDPPTALQRLHTSGGHYTTGDYGGGSNSYSSFFENKNYNDSGGNIHEIGRIKVEGANSFRYDRPSFDDFGLYGSNQPAPKPSTIHKRKNNIPNMPPENHSLENRKKAPRPTMSYPNDSQWTPNSFNFGAIPIKKEPLDEYNSNEMDSQMSYKDSSPSSSGHSSQVKTPEQPKEPKQPPRKRSPGRTCFDRFDKKSTPTSKKVSPLSVYAKVQDCVVISAKSRRYKKRTKPIKEEPVSSPNKEDMETFKRLSLTPDQASKSVVNELIDRVSDYAERNNIIGDLEHMDLNQLRDRMMQVCHRINLDYRDFNDPRCILVPKLVPDTKNSERASAIRRRTSPVEVEEVKTTKRRGRRKAEPQPEVEPRALRQLPGRRSTRLRPYNEDGAPTNSEVIDIDQTEEVKIIEPEPVIQELTVIDLTEDVAVSEASKEAEVQKKSSGTEEPETTTNESPEPEEMSIDDQATAEETRLVEVEDKPEIVDGCVEGIKNVDVKVESKTPEKVVDECAEEIKNVEVKEESKTPEKVVESVKEKVEASVRGVTKVEKLTPEKVIKCQAKKVQSTSTSTLKVEDKALSEKVVIKQEKKNKIMPKNEAEKVVINSTKKNQAAAKSTEKVKPKKAQKKPEKTIKQEPAQDLGNSEIPKPEAEKDRKQAIKSNACKKTPANIAEKAEEKPKKATPKRRRREVSLEIIEEEDTNQFEDRRRTRSSTRGIVKIEEELPKPPPRKRRSCVRPVSSSVFDQDVEIVDVKPRSHSPPTLSPVKPKPAKKSRAKRGSRRRFSKKKKTTKESSVFDFDLVEEMEPPVLRKLETKTKKYGAIKMEPPLLKSEEPVTGKYSVKEKTLPKKLKAISEIKVEPFSSVQDVQKMETEAANSVSEAVFVFKSKQIEPKIEPKSSVLSKDNTAPLASSNTVVKSGSSKRKQGGPTKYLKENSKIISPPFFESPDKILKGNIFSNSLLASFLPAKYPKLDTTSVTAPVSEASLSLKDKYIKFFCSETPYLPNSTPKKPTENGKKLGSSLPSSQNLKSSAEQRVTTNNLKTNIPNETFYNINKKTKKDISSLMSNVKKEPLSDDDQPDHSIHIATHANGDIGAGNKSKAIEDIVSEKKSRKPDCDIKNKASKLATTTNSRPIKKVQRKRSSQCSEGELQVVNKQPDGVVNLRNGAVADELVKKCKIEQMDMSEKGGKDSEYDSDEEKPLACVQKKWKEAKVSLKKETTLLVSEGVMKSKSVHFRRSENSDSEDSYVGLVIDLERRTSVEEQDPTCLIQDAAKPTESPQPTPKEVPTTTNDQTAVTNPTTVFRDATEEAHILLELSRSGAPFIAAPEAPAPFTTVTPAIVIPEVPQTENEGSQSILRTLLLENGDSTLTQDPETSPSEALRAALLQQANLFSMTGGIGSNGFLNHLHPDLNLGTLLDEKLDLSHWDLGEFRAAIQQLKEEIRGLDKMADGKDQELTTIVFYKKYKQEVLKRLMDFYTDKLAKIKEEQGIVEDPCSDELSSATNVTSINSLSANPGESLPTVATMVANATDNYGVDLRNVTFEKENSGTNGTTLQGVTASKETIYQPVAIRSPPTTRSESTPIIQKKSLATQECSFVPNIHSEVPKTSRQRSRPWNYGQSSSSAMVGHPPAETPKSYPLLSTSYNGVVPKTNRRPTPISTPTRRNRPTFDINTIDLRTNPMSPTRPTATGQSSNRPSSANPHSQSSSRSSEVPLFPSGSSNSLSFHRAAASSTYGHLPGNEIPTNSRSIGLHSAMTNDSSRMSTSRSVSAYRPTHGRSTDRLVHSSASGRANAESSRNSLLSNSQPQFMVVPPPTTLPASFSVGGATSEAHSEWPLVIKVEDTHENEENHFRSILQSHK